MQEQMQTTPSIDPTLEWFLSHCHIHKYPSKSTLIHAGEKAETLYYLIKGSVAVLVKDEDGKEMILTYLSQGDFFGEAGLFEEGQLRSAWIKAKALVKLPKFLIKISSINSGQPRYFNAFISSASTSLTKYVKTSK